MDREDENPERRQQQVEGAGILSEAGSERNLQPGSFRPYAYPSDLARFVHERWCAPGAATETASPRPAPDVAVLEQLFATCYQASQLREEERLVTFRAILAPPELFPEAGCPPTGLQRLEFARSRPLNPTELRRLSVAADFGRTLIAVSVDEGLRIWGLIHQGPGWLHEVEGGRRGGPLLPAVPVVHVTAPGILEARKGAELIGRLVGGRLSESRMDVFESEWLPAQFAEFRSELRRLHSEAREEAYSLRGERWAPLDHFVGEGLGQGMLKRVISVVRDSRHGGTIVFLPSERAAELPGENLYLDVRYPLAPAEGRMRYRDLIVRMLNRLAEMYGSRGEADGAEGQGDLSRVGWKHLTETNDEEVAALDEAIYEMAQLIAGLAALDGAVVLGKQVELLGFGAVISGRLPAVRVVARALDPEGDRLVEESTINDGTRHRSAYRLAGALPGTVVVVISQDGGVRFVSEKDGRVVYWEHE